MQGETMITTAVAQTGRRCGDCSLCCYLLNIDSPELRKPAIAWCRHCKPGHGGCSIYSDRPRVCRDFACMWLVNANLGEEWYPQRSKMVLHMAPQHQDADDGQLLLDVVVHPRYPNRWKEAPYYSQLQAMSYNGLTRKFGVHYQVVITIGGLKRWLLFPDREYPYSMGVTLPFDDKFVFLPMKDADKVKQFGDFLTRFYAAAQHVRDKYPNASLEEKTRLTLEELGPPPGERE